VTNDDKWHEVPGYEVDFTDGNAFGVEEFAPQEEDESDFVYIEILQILQQMFVYWYYENVEKSKLEALKQPIFYAADVHWENVYNLLTWEGPVDNGDIENIA
jgi:hypothetical protein